MIASLTFEDIRLQKRSISLYGHKTSVSLEKAFWYVLEDAAHAQGVSLSRLIKGVDEKRVVSLSRALRLYALAFVMSK